MIATPPLQRDARYVIGIDVGGSYIKAGVLDREANLLARVQLPADHGAGWPAFLQRIGDTAEQALAAAGVGLDEVAGIGLGYPGAVSRDTGVVHGSPNTPAEGHALVGPLQQRWQRAVLTINDASAAALGEYRYGQGRDRGARSLALFTLGTGVGGGIILDGQVLYGSHGAASELGHTSIAHDGPRCTCGSFGCVEAYCGAAAIVQAAERRLQRGAESLLTGLVADSPERRLTPRLLTLAADQADPLAREVWAEVGYHLGVACINVINAFDPDLIVVGGQVAQAGEHLLEPLRRTVRARNRLTPWPCDQIVPARLGNDAGIMGAAAVVLQSWDVV